MKEILRRLPDVLRAEELPVPEEYKDQGQGDVDQLDDVVNVASAELLPAGAAAVAPVLTAEDRVAPGGKRAQGLAP